MNKKLPRTLVVSVAILGLVSFSGYLLAGEHIKKLKINFDSIHKAFLPAEEPQKIETPENLSLTEALSVCNAALKNAVPDQWELSEVTITPYAIDNTLLGPSARSAGEDDVSLTIESHILVPDTVGSDGTDDILINFIYP